MAALQRDFSRPNTALTDALDEFTAYVRSSYQWSAATRAEVDAEANALAEMGRVIAEASRKLIELRGKLDFATDYVRAGSTIPLGLTEAELAMCIVDGTFLGEGETVLREYTRCALAESQAGRVKTMERA